MTAICKFALALALFTGSACAAGGALSEAQAETRWWRSLFADTEHSPNRPAAV